MYAGDSLLLHLREVTLKRELKMANLQHLLLKNLDYANSRFTAPSNLTLYKLTVSLNLDLADFQLCALVLFDVFYDSYDTNKLLLTLRLRPDLLLHGHTTP